MKNNLEKVEKEAVEHADTITIESNNLIITDKEGLEYAALLNKQAKDQLKVIEEAFKEHKENAWKAHKALCASEAKAMAPFKSISNILKPKILKYQTEQEEKARKEREAIAAKQRVEEAKAKAKADKEKEKQAAKLRKAGDEEKARMVEEAPTPEPVAVFVPEVKTEKVKGAGTKKVWKARVLNQAAVPEMFKIVNDKALQAYAKSTEGKQAVDGVEFYQETQLTGK